MNRNVNFFHFIGSTVLNFWRNNYQIFKNKLRGFEDYSNFPFDTSRPMPPGAENVMKQCCETLEELGIRYYLTDGTALGLYRNGGFIPHDNDIDVDIIGDVDFNRINSIFVDRFGMTVGRKVQFKGKIRQLIYYTRDKVIFDMVFWESRGEDYFNFVPELDYPRRQAGKYFREPDIIVFKGIKYPVHTAIESWLETRYGANWRIPQNAKGDWRNDCYDIDTNPLKGD